MALLFVIMNHLFFLEIIRSGSLIGGELGEIVISSKAGFVSNDAWRMLILKFLGILEPYILGLGVDWVCAASYFIARMSRYICKGNLTYIIAH